MTKRIAVCAVSVIAGITACGSIMAQQAAFTSAPMWSSSSTGVAGNFSSALLAVNPSGDMALLSDQMPDVVPFGGQYTLGEVPYRISSSLVSQTTLEKSFMVVYDTSDGSAFIGVNAYPGAGGGATAQLCFQAGNSLSGNLALVLWDVPFSVVDTHVTAYDANGDVLLARQGIPYVILAEDYSASLNVCYYKLDGGAIGPQQLSRLKMEFTISNDVIFRDGFS